MGESTWKLFFSGLAMAEKAAAEHCLYIANKFKSLGEEKLSQDYLGYSQEEVGHYELVSELIDGQINITPRAKSIYNGDLFQDKDCVIERLAIVHLAFEPSALAFLGHLVVNADNYFPDREQAQKIKDSFGTILREEVLHILNGKELIVQLLKNADNQTKKRIKKSMRLHKAFLSLGLKSFFKETSEAKEFVNKMLSNYQMRFDNLSQEIA